MLTNRDREVLTWIENYKAITISQASALFFSNSYESARRRLKQLEQMQFLKSYLLKNTKEKVYYYDKKISKHDLLVYDFVKIIKEHGGDLIKLKNQPTYLNGVIRPDAFIIFSCNSMVYFILLEVDLNHYTSNSKMQRYEKLYKTGELQAQCYNTFPIVLIARPTEGIRYNSKNFHVVYLDLLYNNISNLLLQNSNIV